MIQKSYEIKEKGKLYIVPTPIGNKGDITLRAIEILKSVEYILAEDTRETKKLLTFYDVSKPLIACHKFNENKIKEKVLYLLQNNNIALVTDRGTPLISDPGNIIVDYCIENNIDVISIPGASALLPALNMSGIENNKFLFFGFLNSKESIAKKELEKIKLENYTIILYESPYRLKKTLINIFSILGNRKIAICREITKLHEEIYRGTVEKAIEYYKEEVKGEIVIIIEKSIEKEMIDENMLISEVKALIKSGKSFKDSVNEVSKKYNISKNMLYNKIERNK